MAAPACGLLAAESKSAPKVRRPNSDPARLRLPMGCPFGEPGMWRNCNSSNLFRDNVRCAIAATQEAIGFVIADDLLLRRIESQRAAKTIRGIGQVHKRRRDVGFLNGRMNILGATAADAI